LSSDFERAVAFETAMRTRSAKRVIPFRFGHAYFNSTYPRVWDLNTVCVEARGEVDPGEIASDAELLHTDAGLAHRRVDALDDEVGASCKPFLTRLGWEADRLVFMSYRGPGERTTDSVAVDEVSAGDLRSFRRTIARTEPWAEDDETVEMVLDANLLWSDVGAARHFAVRMDGAVVSATDLYSDGRTAQVEDVATSADYRGRGLASAVVLRAVEEALASGHDFVFLIANDENWPRELYAKLGFETIGHTWSFLRKPARSAASLT
jgi:ribosomal protein S18 acetylase RimI-like enzyme